MSSESSSFVQPPSDEVVPFTAGDRIMLRTAIENLETISREVSGLYEIVMDKAVAADELDVQADGMMACQTRSHRFIIKIRINTIINVIKNCFF